MCARGCVAQRSRFYSHTQETFDVVFSLTVDAFKVLEQVVDLNSLNFVITYSSKDDKDKKGKKDGDKSKASGDADAEMKDAEPEEEDVLDEAERLRGREGGEVLEGLEDDERAERVPDEGDWAGSEDTLCEERA